MVASQARTWAAARSAAHGPAAARHAARTIAGERRLALMAASEDRPGLGQEDLLVEGHGVAVGHAGDEVPDPDDDRVAGRVGTDVVLGAFHDVAEEVDDDLLGLAQLVAGR